MHSRWQPTARRSSTGTGSTPMATLWWSSDPEASMTFSNPAAQASDAATGYVQALLTLLGQRNPIEVLRELPRWIDERIKGVSEAALRRPEKPGKWSAIEVIQHLAD